MKKQFLLSIIFGVFFLMIPAITNAQQIVSDSLKNELIVFLSQDEDFEYLHLGIFDDLRSVKLNNNSKKLMHETKEKYQKADKNLEKKYPLLQFLTDQELWMVESKARDRIIEEEKEN